GAETRNVPVPLRVKVPVMWTCSVSMSFLSTPALVDSEPLALNVPAFSISVFSRISTIPLVPIVAVAPELICSLRPDSRNTWPVRSEERRVGKEGRARWLWEHGQEVNCPEAGSVTL